MARHPGLLAEVWPVGEFTYLATGRAHPPARIPAGLGSAYWSQEDPLSWDGTRAESMRPCSSRRGRCERLQAWSRSVPAEAQLWMVSHAQFLWALGWCLSLPLRPRWFVAADAGFPFGDRPEWPALGWREWAESGAVCRWTGGGMQGADAWAVVALSGGQERCGPGRPHRQRHLRWAWRGGDFEYHRGNCRLLVSWWY